MKSFYLIAVVIATFNSTLIADTLTVDNRPNAVAMFSDLGAAIAAAQRGDTIQLAGSQSGYGTHTIDKQLHFRGVGYFIEENQVEGLNRHSAKCGLQFEPDVLTGGSSGSSVANLEIENTVRVHRDVSGILFSKVRFTAQFADLRGSVSISRCYLRNLSFYPEGEQGSSNVQNSIITGVLNLGEGASANRCLILNQPQLSYLKSTSHPQSTINDSIFVQGQLAATDLKTEMKGSMSHCLGIGDNLLFEQSGNFNLPLASSVFVLGDSIEGKWKLKSGSPALGAGLNGGDLGPFAGPNPYSLSGLPKLPRITNLSIDAVATDANGLSFTVETVAEGTTAE